MSECGSGRARQVFASLVRVGWTIKRQSGSPRTLSKSGFPDFVFSFHDSEDIGPRMLPRIGKRTGLKPNTVHLMILIALSMLIGGGGFGVGGGGRKVVLL